MSKQEMIAKIERAAAKYKRISLDLAGAVVFLSTSKQAKYLAIRAASSCPKLAQIWPKSGQIK